MKEKILILVKTYPTFSRKYFELVCTAGINEKGEWRRVYPIPFRKLKDLEQYKKYQWVEMEIEKNASDPRPESYKLKQGVEISISGESLSTKDDWQERKEALQNTPVYTCLDEVIWKAKEENCLSLCQFKPEQIIGLKIEPAEREWNRNILNTIAAENAQSKLFGDLEHEITIVDKLPYKFSYQFLDDKKRVSTLMIEDWEIGQLYWNCLKQADKNEEQACRKVREKYEGFIKKNDLTLFLGTTRQFHSWANNPFVIIGVFYPPKKYQQELFQCVT